MKSTITKLLMTAVSVAAMGAAAQAADPAPAGVVSNILDGAAPGTVTVAGITVYGTIDVGAVYNSHSTVGQQGSFYAGNEYPVSKNSNASRWDYQNNALAQSLIGFKGTQSLQALSDGLKGWSVGFDLQIGFDPLYGQLADVAKTLVHNNGVGQLAQTSNADGSRYGQVFNGEAYGSLKNDVLGELRFGRQNTLMLSTLAAYDAQAGSYAYSFFSYFGATGGGGGTTNDARWNNALKYTNTIGPVRVGGAYRFDGGGQGGDAWSLQAGIDLPGALKGLSIDGVYAKENSAIVLSSLSAKDCGLLGIAGTCNNTNLLNGTVSDNEAWAVMAKYKINQATIFGGYERVMLNNPSSQLTNLNSEGYSINNGYGGSTKINYNAYTTEKDIDVYWVGGKYAFTPKLTGSAAWYRLSQNSYVAANTTCAAKTASNAATAGFLGSTAAAQCAGELNWYSLSLDYQATQRLDFYSGITWTDVGGGAASGYTNTSSYNVSFGTRFRF